MAAGGCVSAPAAAAAVASTSECTCFRAFRRADMRQTVTMKPSRPLKPYTQKVQSVKNEIQTYPGLPSPFPAEPQWVT